MKILVVSVNTGSAHVNLRGGEEASREGRQARPPVTPPEKSPHDAPTRDDRPSSLARRPLRPQPPRTFPAKSRSSHRSPLWQLPCRRGPTSTRPGIARGLRRVDEKANPPS